MRRVLIITTHFAPDIHVGAKRPTKFAGFLPQYGWQPVILTKEIGRYHGVDDTLEAGLPPETPICRVREWHFSYHRGLRRTATSGGPVATEPARTPNHKLKSLAVSLWDRVFFLNYSWLLPALFAGLHLSRRERIDLLFSTSPDPEAHIVAMLLKSLSGIRWVSEFRDPWTGLLTSYRPRSRVERAINRRLERMVLRRSDWVVNVSELMKESSIRIAGRRSKDKMSVIYNGYDAEDFVGPDKALKQDDRFVITYVGTWGHLVTPEFFMRALAGLLRKKPHLREKMAVVFVGEVKFDVELAARIDRVISQEGLERIVHRVGFLPHKEGLSYLCTSDVLLLVIGTEDSQPGATDWRIPAKLFEYLCASKPILALVPPDGETARILRETKVADVVSPTDIAGIEEKIFDMYQRFATGNLTPERPEIGRFDRRVQTGSLAEIFDSLVPAQGATRHERRRG